MFAVGKEPQTRTESITDITSSSLNGMSIRHRIPFRNKTWIGKNSKFVGRKCKCCMCLVPVNSFPGENH